MSAYIGILIFLVMAATATVAFVLLASVPATTTPSAATSEPFECGGVALSDPTGHVTVKFYLTAILFILFDVELVFLYPWAVAFRGLGAWGLGEMVIFLGIVLVGFFYAWDNGALEWN